MDTDEHKLARLRRADLSDLRHPRIPGGIMARDITLDDVKRREDITIYLSRADQNMEAIGYTEHGFRHANLVADRARGIMQALGRSPREIELAAIAGYLHDIGNVATREEHEQVAVVLAYSVLKEMGMPPAELADIMAGVGNHEEPHGEPFGPVAAAVIIADKSDVARSRVRDIHPSRYDEHDRVNYATISSDLSVNREHTLISLHLETDTQIAPIMEYFELFLQRMVMARRAARVLGCEFELVINGTKLL
jgi:metal-dependent HD superfamily phosphatase/phosphodiesterase